MFVVVSIPRVTTCWVYSTTLRSLPSTDPWRPILDYVYVITSQAKLENTDNRIANVPVLT